MKKTLLVIGILLLILLRAYGAGYAELLDKDWIRDPRVMIEVSDRTDENGTYNVYYCVDDTYVVMLERDIYMDTGWITLSRGDYGRCELLYETDWGSMQESEQIINNLIEQVLSARGS